MATPRWSPRPLNAGAATAPVPPRDVWSGTRDTDRPDHGGLILPGQPETTETAVLVCDRCGCLVAAPMTAAHDRACGGAL